MPSTRTLIALIFASMVGFGIFAVCNINSAEGYSVKRHQMSIIRATLPPTTSPLQPTDIQRELRDLKTVIEKKKKDNWDKIASVSALVSGLMIATIGGIATYTVGKYQNRSETTRSDRELMVQRASVIPPLIPYFGSNKEADKRAAILAIDAMGDPELAARLAEIYGGEGSASAMSRIAARSSPEAAVLAEKSLEILFESLKISILQLIVDQRPAASGFVVAPGHILTTAHALGSSHVEVVFQDYTSETYVATFSALDASRDLALFQINRQDIPAVPFELQVEREEVTAFGYTGSSSGPVIRVGSVTAFEMTVPNIPGGEDMIETRLPVVPGFSGAPGVNSRGHAIGMVSASDENDYTLLISAGSIVEFLREHGLEPNIASLQEVPS